MDDRTGALSPEDSCGQAANHLSSWLPVWANRQNITCGPNENRSDAILFGIVFCKPAKHAPAYSQSSSPAFVIVEIARQAC